MSGWNGSLDKTQGNRRRYQRIFYYLKLIVLSNCSKVRLYQNWQEQTKRCDKICHIYDAAPYDNSHQFQAVSNHHEEVHPKWGRFLVPTLFADTLEWKAFDEFLWKCEKYEKHFQHMKILIYLRHLLIWKKIDENKNHSLEIISGSFWCVLSLRLLLRFNSAFNWEVMINLFNWCDMINLFNFAIKTVKTPMYILLQNVTN